MLKIILHVFLEFSYPEISSGFWCCGILAILMPVPEASVNKNHSFIFRKYNIRFSREPWIILSESKPAPEQAGTHLLFYCGVLSMDAGHIPASLFW